MSGYPVRLILLLFTILTISNENIYGQISTIDQTKKSEMKKVNNLFEYAENIRAKFGYKAAVDSLLSLESVYQDSNPAMKSYYNQVLMTFYSFIGDLPNTLSYERKALTKGSINIFEFPTSTKTLEATEYICQKFGNTKILLLNEAHASSQNRAFLRDLLPKLKKLGFNYLAIEDLSHKDSLINKRKYPIQKSGYYIKDPIFSQAIRRSLELGFKLVPIDDTTGFNPNESVLDGQNRREQTQAHNIINIIKTDTSAKVIVYSGHDHIHKSSDNGWIRMGERLVKDSKLDVISIDCATMREGTNSLQESAYFKGASKRFDSQKKPYVILDSSSVFVSPPLKSKIDLNVFFPRTNFTSGFPDWMNDESQRKRTIKLKRFANNTLIQIYSTEEIIKEGLPNVIPIIQFVKSEKFKKINVSLKSGKYLILGFNSKNDSNQLSKEITIK